MKNSPRNILPVLLGGDLNAYSVALAFREEYGVTSHAFVRYKCGATENSSFIKTHVCTELGEVKTAISVLLRFAAENTGAELFLIPCSDPYVRLLQEIKEHLSGLYRIDIPQIDLWRRLSDKASFYKLLSDVGIPYPDCVVFTSKEDITEEKLGIMEYPAVLKPSDSAEYWRYPFPDMRKVYFPKNKETAKRIAEQIFDSGYSKAVILQKKIGSRESNRVLTTYSDKSGRVVRAVLGEVVLEECGKTSYGNHSAIITRPPDEICFALIELLNTVGYCGFANFDIMADGNEKYVLEINTRQGRSCDYLRAAGVNIAKLVVENAGEGNISPSFSYKEIYWHYPPHSTVMEYCSKDSRDMIKSIHKRGDGYTPYINGYERLLRRAYVAVHNRRLAKAIKKQCDGSENN